MSGRTHGRPDERINPSDTGRMTRNWVKVFRTHKLMQSMIRHSLTASESWKNLPWKQFQRTLFRLQKRVYKAVQVGDKRKARSLQKLILKSQAARLLAIRQVTQLNAGKKTAGIDGKASLNFEERLLANIALNGIEEIHKYKHRHGSITESCIRYADDMVIILRPEDDAEAILSRIGEFLAIRGMKVSDSKTRITATTEGFDFLGWHFKVQQNGKFRCSPSVENYKAFRKKIKHIVNNSNYGATTKAEKLAPVVRGWRNYHKYCKMEGSRNSLYFIQKRAYTVFNKETKQNKYSSKLLLDKAFPTVPYSENKHINVKGNKSPFDGDLSYWSERNSKLYDGTTSKALKKQNHSCASCGLKFVGEERVHLHHVDGNHDNWKQNNLVAIHESCHDYLHMSKSAS